MIFTDAEREKYGTEKLELLSELYDALGFPRPLGIELGDVELTIPGEDGQDDETVLFAVVSVEELRRALDRARANRPQQPPPQQPRAQPPPQPQPPPSLPPTAASVPWRRIVVVGVVVAAVLYLAHLFSSPSPPPAAQVPPEVSPLAAPVVAPPPAPPRPPHRAPPLPPSATLEQSPQPLPAPPPPKPPVNDDAHDLTQEQLDRLLRKNAPQTHPVE